MRTTYSFTIGGFAALAILAVAIALFSNVGRTAHASYFNGTVIGAATTSEAVTVTTSTRVLATTTNALGTGTSYSRVYATICNPSSTLVYLNLNQDKTSSLPSGTFTTVIAAATGYNACYEITDRNLYSGSIQASSTNETSTKVYVSDYVQ